MENKQTLLQFTMTNGLVLGIVLVIFSVLLYMLNIMPDTLGKIMLIPLFNAVVVIIFVVKGTKSYRNKILGGTISYRNAFLVGLLIIVFAYILKSFYDLIFNLLIDPGYMERLYEGLFNWAYNFYSNIGFSESQIDEVIKRFERQQDNYTPIRAFFSSVFASASMGAVLSLITAAILKKDPLPFGQDEQ